ncbi:N6-adenine methyltransferase [Fadolivirus algeromassiliense]|jgi:hypothetical protein|uniref:N6-adenine methyltransferase n=1 Tax=Fadolivirus FV1/VV64 TaxID=3070911 RepID=A0A7D3V7N7_9VIRU|nr:N6-adenine methyltransferase [Fadolivirus algeromassiliense]QKF94236.1 N6-adenine methyltransferase [Fadolivirus FV1/VV64]
MNHQEKRQINMILENGGTPIPKNIFIKNQGNVFKNYIEEQHAFEQFFWTKDTVKKLADAFNYRFVEETMCLMTPSMAHWWHENGREETLLDIDKRFSYIPKFKYYDVFSPEDIDDKFRMLIIDPPFFAVPIEQIRIAVDSITKNDYSTHILIAFLKRGEKRLREAFAPYNLVPTKFPLQYASIKPNKWSNFVLYSNIDLPGIKRIKE